MAVPSRRVGLPHFNERPGNSAPFFIQYPATYDDAFSLGLAAVLMSEVIIVFADLAMAKNRAGELG